MPPRVRFMFSVLIAVFFILAAVPLYAELTRRSDIWWTPRAMLVPLDHSTDRVELYARGTPLAALLQAGQLRVAEGDGWTVLTASDVGLRFNNWDRVRGERFPLLLGNAAVCGAIALLFLLVLTGRLAYRGEKERAAES